MFIFYIFQKCDSWHNYYRILINIPYWQIESQIRILWPQKAQKKFTAGVLFIMYDNDPSLLDNDPILAFIALIIHHLKQLYFKQLMFKFFKLLRSHSNSGCRFAHSTCALVVHPYSSTAALFMQVSARKITPQKNRVSGTCINTAINCIKRVCWMKFFFSESNINRSRDNWELGECGKI